MSRTRRGHLVKAVKTPPGWPAPTSEWLGSTCSCASLLFLGKHVVWQ